MIELPFYHSYSVAVMGLGKKGLATARALMASGAGAPTRPSGTSLWST